MPVPRSMSPWQLGSAAVILVGLVASVIVAMNGYVRSEESPKNESLYGRSEQKERKGCQGDTPRTPPAAGEVAHAISCACACPHMCLHAHTLARTCARLHVRSLAHALARTCSRPHVSRALAQQALDTRPHMRSAAHALARTCARSGRARLNLLHVCAGTTAPKW
jgi:hypothetical protein